MKTAMAQLLLLAILPVPGCGGSEGGDAATAPQAAPPPAKPRKVALAVPPEECIVHYGLIPVDKFRGGQTPAADHYKPKYTPEELQEAARQGCAALSTEQDLERVLRYLLCLTDHRRLAEAARSDPGDRYVPMPDKTFKPYVASLDAAEKIIQDALVARLRAFTTAGPEFMAFLKRLGASERPLLVRAALEEYRRLDRPAAEELIFTKSFTRLPWPPDRAEIVPSPETVIPMAAELDKARAAKGLDAWLEGVRLKSRNLSTGASPELGRVLHSLLDLDRSRERFLRLASHPMVYSSVGTGFLKAYVLARKPAPPLTDLERAEILVALGKCGDIGRVDFPALEEVVGKTFESGGDSLVEPVAKLFASAPSDHFRYLLERFLPPALAKLNEAQYLALFRRLRQVAPPEALKLLRYFLGQVYGQPGAPQGAIVRAAGEMLGKDEKENSEWLYVFRQRIPTESLADLAKALQREEIPLQTILTGIHEAFRAKKTPVVLPLIDKTIRTRPKEIGTFLDRIRDSCPPAELVSLADGFIESFKGEGKVEHYSREYRRKVIELGAPPDAAPRLVELLAKAAEKESKIDLFRTVIVLNDKRVVKALVDLQAKETSPWLPFDTDLQKMVGEPARLGEKLPQWYDRIKSKLPPQESPKE